MNDYVIAVIILVLALVGLFALLLAAWVFVVPYVLDSIYEWRTRRAAP